MVVERQKAVATVGRVRADQEVGQDPAWPGISLFPSS